MNIYRYFLFFMFLLGSSAMFYASQGSNIAGSGATAEVYSSSVQQLHPFGYWASLPPEQHMINSRGVIKNSLELHSELRAPLFNHIENGVCANRGFEYILDSFVVEGVGLGTYLKTNDLLLGERNQFWDHFRSLQISTRDNRNRLNELRDMICARNHLSQSKTREYEELCLWSNVIAAKREKYYENQRLQEFQRRQMYAAHQQMQQQAVMQQASGFSQTQQQPIQQQTRTQEWPQQQSSTHVLQQIQQPVSAQVVPQLSQSQQTSGQSHWDSTRLRALLANPSLVSSDNIW